MNRSEDINKPQLIRELSLEGLLFTTMCLLLGEEGTDFSYYETDLDWWTLRLWTRRN